MPTYQLPEIQSPPSQKRNEMFLIASGDSRLSANQTCWPARADTERQIIAAFAAEGVTVTRAHPYDDSLKHGFIWNQRMGMDVFKSIPPAAPLIVAVAFWQYVLAGLRGHQGPIHWARNCSKVTAGRDEIPLGIHNTIMADHECRLTRCKPESINGSA